MHVENNLSPEDRQGIENLPYYFKYDKFSRRFEYKI